MTIEKAKELELRDLYQAMSAGIAKANCRPHLADPLKVPVTPDERVQYWEVLHGETVKQVP